jgi:hypothetical protein
VKRFKFWLANLAAAAAMMLAAIYLALMMVT